MRGGTSIRATASSAARPSGAIVLNGREVTAQVARLTHDGAPAARLARMDEVRCGG
jgi:hypothetical protein